MHATLFEFYYIDLGLDAIEAMFIVVDLSLCRLFVEKRYVLESKNLYYVPKNLLLCDCLPNGEKNCWRQGQNNT